jgi:UDP-glucuronate decarboxylase
MLGMAKRVGAKFLLASTSEIYGDPEIHPQPETYRGNVNPIGLRSCYDEGKRIAETLTFDYKRSHDIEIKVARIFNTYGPRMLPNDGRVVSNLIIQGLSSQSMTLYGDGLQTRSFCYVDDLIEGFIKLMDSQESGPINIGNPNETTILDLARLISKKLNIKEKFIFKELPQDDPLQRKPIIKKAQEKLNWYPKIDLNSGIDKTIKYFKNINN